MIYLQLFLSFLQIGLFSFGGGYAAMPLIQDQVVTRYGWLSMAEFTDLITISQMTPGPIAVNSATFVGIRIAGIPGALVATFGCILPSCILVTAIARLYLKYRNMSVLQGVLPPPGSGGPHRLGGHLHSPDRLLGRRRCDLLGHQLADGRPLCSGLPAAPDPSHRPHPGDASGRPSPGGSVAPAGNIEKICPLSARTGAFLFPGDTMAGRTVIE